MSLHLDSRQRAMLKEMGVPLWWPGAMAQEPAATPSTHGTPPQPAPTVTTHAAPAPIKAPQPLRPVLPVQPATLHGQTLPARVLLPPRALFPGTDPQHTPAALGAGWLIVADGLADADPLEGEAGRLLGNMLRALQLHRHPRVFLCALSAAHGPSTDAAPPDEVLAQALASVKPSVLLLMGRAAALAVLGRTEPLGQLRGQAHRVAGLPAVITYDAPYLLRAPQAKPAAWADLCLARVLARSTPAAP